MSLVITGSPGVGKHTLAKKIAKEMNLKILDISKIALEEGLCEKGDEAIDVDVRKLKLFLKNKITKDTLLVGHLAPYVVTKSKVKVAIVLRKNPYKLIPIYKKRKYSDKKIADNVGGEILGVVSYDARKNFGKAKTHQIDATSKSILKLIKLVKAIIEGKFDNEEVDWLNLVSEKKDLKKFFSY